MKPKMKEFLKQMGRLQEEDYVTAEEFYGMFSKILDAVKAASVNNENKLSELNKIADKKAKELESYFVTLLEAVDERMGEVKNGNDGKDGETPVAGVDYPSYDEIRSFIKEQVEKLPQPGSAAEEITVDYIKDALMSLEGNDRLPYSAINGIEQFIDEKVRIMESNLRRGPMAITGGGTGSGGGSSTFTGLSDTPSTYTGQGGKVVAVNVGETALEFISASGVGTVTSVAVSGSDGIEVDSGSPITAAGTVALGLNKATTLSFLNVEDGADVTDATNVAAAGAIMDGDFSTNGLMKRTGAGTYATATAGTDYIATETDPVVGAVSGIVKANGAGSISAAVAGTDYLAPAAIGSTVQAYDTDLTTWAGITPGTGVGTALAANVGSAGAVVVNGGALGTPSSGTVTNLTGTASININGTVGATTPAAGAFTTVSASSAITASTTVELGHATDTTLSRSSAGVIAVEGVVIPSISSTNTLTNKRVTKRVGSTTSSATPTINTDNVDAYHLTAQAVDITSFTTNLSGTPTDFQQLRISITGTAARAITWGASFANGPVALPTTTVTTTRLDVLLEWNTVTSKWRCMASGSTQ